MKIRCPHCDALCSFSGMIETDMVAFCGKCHGAITREIRRAFFRGVSADISARQVERENREFLEYLNGGWSDSKDGE